MGRGGVRARARTDSPVEHNVTNKTGRRVHSPWHSHPGVPKRREYSHRPSRSHGHEDVPIQADSIRFGDRRVRLLTVNLNADDLKTGELRRARKACCAEPSENREISQTCDSVV